MAEEKVTRSKGVVIRFNDQKGYGFIQPDDGGEDLFVHQTAVKSDGFRSLHEGQIVEFTIILEGNKTKAVEVSAPGGGPIRRGSDRNNRAGAGGGYGFSDRRNGGGECYSCGEFGHMASDCIGRVGGGNGSSCYNCGGYGHLARECPSASRRGGGNSGACFACGEPGHMARDCMGGGGGFGRFGGRVGGGKCFNCGESGHFAKECTEPSRG